MFIDLEEVAEISTSNFGVCSDGGEEREISFFRSGNWTTHGMLINVVDDLDIRLVGVCRFAIISEAAMGRKWSFRTPR